MRRLQVHQPTTPSPSSVEEGRTKIVVSDTTSSLPPQVNNNNEGLSGGLARLRVKMEIHPISHSNYFHVVLLLQFISKSDEVTESPPIDDFGDGGVNQRTTDTVELLFLAELRRGSKHGEESHHRSRSEGCTPKSSSPLGKGAFVDLTVGSELFVINVFTEDKARSKEEGMREQQSLGLCHRVIVKVSKKSPKGGKRKAGKKSQDPDVSRTDTCTTSNTSGGRWFRHLRPSPLRRVVTVDDDDEDSSDLLDSTASAPEHSNPPTSTEVCLQSWRVKTITSQEMMSPTGTTQDILNEENGAEATMIASGNESFRVTRGVLLNF